jgi:galactose mutarotase-like enzyme
MHFTHDQSEAHGHSLDLLSEESSGLRIAVSRQGAELVSLTKREEDGSWTGFLYRDGDLSPAEKGWNNHATLMGYFLHRLKNERTVYRGHEIRGGTHSFLRHKTFCPPEFQVDGDSGSLVYRILPEMIEPEEYPLRVSFSLTYTIQNGALRVTFSFRNEEPDTTAHVSFGLHPGFAAASIESAQVWMPKGRYVRHLAPGNFLSGETEEIVHEGGPMPFDKSQLNGSFLLELRDVPLPLFTFADEQSGREVDLNFSGAPYVTIWSDGNPFICVEPCWGLPDHHEQRPFEEKLGIQEIAPGAELVRSFSMTPRLPRGVR